MVPIAISTTSILARVTRDGASGAVATRSAASSPEIVSQARPPASCPAAITMTGVTSTIASALSAKLRHSISAGGTRYNSCIRVCDTSQGSRRNSTNSFQRSACCREAGAETPWRGRRAGLASPSPTPDAAVSANRGEKHGHHGAEQNEAAGQEQQQRLASPSAARAGHQMMLSTSGASAAAESEVSTANRDSVP